MQTLLQRFTSQNNDNDIIIRLGEVISVDDEYGGSRIKVRMEQDNGVLDKDLPYVFPLLPKTIQSVPKIGEAVIIITSKLNNAKSMRYYIGPLISQPQYQYKDEFNKSFGTATSLIQGGYVKPLTSIQKYDETNGAFPEINDIALVGRKSEDIILKDGEIDIRCGIRTKKVLDAFSPEYYDVNLMNDLKGDVIFNTHSPAYLQLKYERGLCKGKNQVADSVINLVADKINLISHKDTEYFNLTNPNTLINKEDLDDIMSKLHQVPHGDKLVEVLEKIINSIANHCHAYPGLPPCNDDYIKSIKSSNLNDILSTDVRIS